MAYRFKLNEPVQKGLVRIGREQIGRALQELRAERGKASAIHETRKCLKRTRALLRLAAPGLDAKAYADLNGRLRDVGKLLSPARDKEILRETIAKLGALDPAPAAAPIEALKSIVEAQRQTGGRVGPEAMLEALKALREVNRRFAELELSPADFTPIEQGLKTSARRMKKRFDAAFADATDEACHEWRKAIQQYWRHTQLVSRAWPEISSARIEMARRLSQLLGDDHDLSILAHFIAALPEGALTPAHTHELERLIRRRQNELREAARPRGMMLIADGSKGLARRTRAIWEAAQQLAKADVAPPEPPAAEPPRGSPAKPKPRSRPEAAAPARRPAHKAAGRPAQDRGARGTPARKAAGKQGDGGVKPTVAAPPAAPVARGTAPARANGLPAPRSADKDA